MSDRRGPAEPTAAGGDGAAAAADAHDDSGGEPRARAMPRTRFDAEHGTDTGGIIEPRFLGHGARVERQSVSYEATDPAAFRAMMAELPIRHEDYTFIDLGSGKGRVVLLAAELPFRRVIGVEASPKLHRIARANLRAFDAERQRCGRVGVILGDAPRMTPPDDNLVLYLFNPFRERAMTRLLLGLKETLQVRPRDIWLIYYNPQLQFMFEKAPFLARVALGRGYQQGDYCVYRSHGEYRGAVVDDTADAEVADDTDAELGQSDQS